MSADGLVTIDSQPRVNSEMLEKQVGHVVLLIGSFKNWEGSRLTVQAADGKDVIVQGMKVDITKTYVEVVGKVNADKSISAYSITDLGDSFDLGSYNDAIKLLPAFTGIF